MRKHILLFFVWVGTHASFAQQTETFDLATYRAPTGWKKINQSPHIAGYVTTDERKGTFCQLIIFPSTINEGSLQADFVSEWENLIVSSYHPSSGPRFTPMESRDAWSVLAGAAPFEFEGAESAAMLVTASGYGRCMSIVVITNTSIYEKDVRRFLESMVLSKPETIVRVVDSN